MSHTYTYAALWSQIVQDTRNLATQLMGRVKPRNQQATNDCMLPQLRQPNPKSQSAPPSLNSHNVYQHRTPNTLTRFSTLYATFPRHHHHSRNTKPGHTLKNRSSRRFSSLWEVQLELGEIPGMLSPNILEPYRPIPQPLPLSPHNNAISSRLFIEHTIANGNSNHSSSGSYSSFSTYDFSDTDAREDEGEEDNHVEGDEEEKQRVEGREELEGEDEEEQDEGDGDEPFSDYYFPDGTYSYTVPLHPSDSTSSLLLPEPLPWVTIVDTCPEEREDETTPYPSSSSSALSTSPSLSSLRSSVEILVVKYETRETIVEDDEGEEDEMDTDGLEPSSVAIPARATAHAIHPLDRPYTTPIPALEEQDDQDNDAKDQERTQAISFSNAPISSSKSIHPAATPLFSSVYSEMCQDRKDSGVFIMHDDGFVKMETENGPFPLSRPASVLANHEPNSVMDQGDTPSPPSQLHMYSSLMMSSSLISLSA